MISPRHRETLRAAALLSVVLLVFLWTPITQIGSMRYSTADISQISPLTRVEANYRPKNQLTSDPAVQMQPWLMFNRDELRAGRIPLWNPYNGNGSPHLANYQSAVFSPFSLPFYVLPFGVALVAAAFLKLFALGFFTFLYLRALKLAWWPSVIAAAAFMLAANNIVLLSYPHAGAIALLPAALWCAEVVFARLHAAWGASRPWIRDAMPPLLGLAFTLGVGLLCGQPEITYFCVLLIAAYSGFRLGMLWFDHGRDRAALRRTGWASLALILAGCVGLCTAAVQVLPFFEYAEHSTLAETRASTSHGLDPRTWPLAVFPELLGDPTKPYTVTLSVPPPTFEAAASICVGGFVLFLSLVSMGRMRRREHVFFAIVLAAWLPYAYDLFGCARFLEKWVPLLSIAPISHCTHVGMFALCVCAAFALDAIATQPRVRHRALFAAALAFAAFFAWGASRYGPSDYPRLQKSPEFLAASASHETAMLALFGLAILAVMAIERSRARKAKVLAWALLLFAVCASGGGQLTEYNPTVPESVFFPRTAAMRELQEHVGEDRVVVLGAHLLPPDTNMVYGIRTPASYDAMWIGAYDELYQDFFGHGDNWRDSSRASPKALDLFGVRYVLERASSHMVGQRFAGTSKGIRRRFVVGGLRAGHEIVQSFTPSHDNLCAIRLFLYLRDSADRPLTTIDVRLVDDDEKRTVFERSVPVENVDLGQGYEVPIEIPFEPIERSRGRHLSLHLAGQESSLVDLWASSGPLDDGARQLQYNADPPDKFVYAGESVEGRVLFECCYDAKRFREVARIGELSLHEHAGGCFGPHVVHESSRAASDEAARERVQDPRFDPAQEVVIGASVPATEETVPPSDDRRAVELVSRDSTRERWTVNAQAPGWLVLDLPWYPGWSARVDGNAVPLVRANYAFCALPIAAGPKTVELEYAPRSFRIGAITSLASLLVLGFLATWLRLSRAA